MSVLEIKQLWKSRDCVRRAHAQWHSISTISRYTLASGSIRITWARLPAWLKTILTHNLLTVAKHFGTKKSDAGREVSLQDQLEQSSALLHCQLVAEQSSPSTKLMKQERSEQLAETLLKLLEDERAAVVLKHFHSWSVAEIAQHLDRTQEAVAGLLRRGLRKLRDHLSEESDIPRRQ